MGKGFSPRKVRSIVKVANYLFVDIKIALKYIHKEMLSKLFTTYIRLKSEWLSSLVTALEEAQRFDIEGFEEGDKDGP